MAGDNYICIGDIHGRVDLLELLLGKIQRDQSLPGSYQLVFMGDYVDRGPASFHVVQRIKQEVESGHAIAILGNHEHMMLSYHRKRTPNKQDIWLANGGTKTIQSYNDYAELYGFGHFFVSFERSGHAQFLKSLPLYYETEKIWFSHAPIAANWSGDQVKERGSGHFRDDALALLWTCENSDIEGRWERAHGKTAVCGHVHALFQNNLHPRVFDHIIYTDTGCGCSDAAPLTGVILVDGKYSGYIQAFPHELKEKGKNK